MVKLECAYHSTLNYETKKNLCFLCFMVKNMWKKRQCGKLADAIWDALAKNCKNLEIHDVVGILEGIKLCISAGAMEKIKEELRMKRAEIENGMH